MSHLQTSIFSARQAFPDFTSILNRSGLINSQSPSIGSPSTSADSGQKDWMSSVLAFENINKAGLMNVLNLKNMPMPTTSIPKDLNTGKCGQSGQRKYDAKLEPGLEEAPIVKKVKLGQETIGAPVEQIPLSSLVDRQMQRLSQSTSESVDRLMAQANLSKSIKSPGFSNYKPNKDLRPEDKPLRILSFKIDSETKEFLYFIEWRQRADGSKPAHSFIPKEELMRMNPELIIAFYEQQMANTFQTIAEKY